MLRPAGLDPNSFVRRGLEDKKMEEALILSGKQNGGFAALGYEGSSLSNFRRGGPWDAQRIGGFYHDEFVDYATVAIGLYAAANGISESRILSYQDLVARTSRYRSNTEMDKQYTHLPIRNVQNTHLGYTLYQSGQIGPSAQR